MLTEYSSFSRKIIAEFLDRKLTTIVRLSRMQRRGQAFDDSFLFERTYGMKTAKQFLFSNLISIYIHMWKLSIDDEETSPESLGVPPNVSISRNCRRSDMRPARLRYQGLVIPTTALLSSDSKVHILPVNRKLIEKVSQTNHIKHHMNNLVVLLLFK